MPTTTPMSRIVSATALTCFIAIVLAPALRADGPQRTERPKYFDGKLLSAADFEKDQDYYRRDSDLTAPFGKISGLGVSLDGGSLTIAAGHATSRSGEEVVLSDPLRIERPVADGKYYAVVCAVLREQGRRCQAVAVVERRAGRIRIAAADAR